MAKVNRSIRINAPVRKVFEFVTSPDNWTRYVTSLMAVKDQSPDLPKKGGTFGWEYKMLGFRLTGKGAVTDYARNRSFGLRLDGKATVEEFYEFIEGDDGDTTLKVRVEYEMPLKAVEQLMNTRLGEKLNSLESKHVLENIKAMCEA